MMFIAGLLVGCVIGAIAATAYLVSEAMYGKYW